MLKCHHVLFVLSYWTASVSSAAAAAAVCDPVTVHSTRISTSPHSTWSLNSHTQHNEKPYGLDDVAAVKGRNFTLTFGGAPIIQSLAAQADVFAKQWVEVRLRDLHRVKGVVIQGGFIDYEPSDVNSAGDHEHSRQKYDSYVDSVAFSYALDNNTFAWVKDRKDRISKFMAPDNVAQKRVIHLLKSVRTVAVRVHPVFTAYAKSSLNLDPHRLIRVGLLGCKIEAPILHSFVSDATATDQEQDMVRTQYNSEKKARRGFREFWYMEAKPDERIAFKIEEMSMAQSPDCHASALTIYDGEPGSKGAPLYKVCGDTKSPKTFNSISNKMTVEFSTSHKNDMTRCSYRKTAGGPKCGTQTFEGNKRKRRFRRTKRSYIEQYAQHGDWPWSVQIMAHQSGKGTVLLCGGSKLDDHWILTAAHCVERIPTKALRVRNIFRHHSKVVKVFLHQDYVGCSDHLAGADIALLRLSNPLFGNHACLPEKTDGEPSSVCVATSFQQSGYRHSRPVEHLPDLVSQSSCQEMIQQQNHTSEALDKRCICASLPEDEMQRGCTQETDGGNPLVCEDRSSGRWTLRGIYSSRGKNSTCDFGRDVSVLAAVDHYTSWIKDVMRSYVPAEIYGTFRPWDQYPDGMV